MSVLLGEEECMLLVFPIGLPAKGVAGQLLSYFDKFDNWIENVQKQVFTTVKPLKYKLSDSSRVSYSV